MNNFKSFAFTCGKTFKQRHINAIQFPEKRKLFCKSDLCFCRHIKTPLTNEDKIEPFQKPQQNEHKPKNNDYNLKTLYQASLKIGRTLDVVVVILVVFPSRQKQKQMQSAYKQPAISENLKTKPQQNKICNSI